MPILPRKTVIDRPTLVDREEDEDNQAQQNGEGVVEELGEGDGPIINRIRFDKGDYGVVAASNLVSILSTAQTEGEQFEQAFMTAAIQIKEMADSGIDISSLARMSRDRGVDDVNVPQSKMQDLKLATHDIDDEASENPEESTEEESEEDIVEEVQEIEEDEEASDEEDDANEDSTEEDEEVNEDDEETS